jgi:hypothetical protein
VAKVGERIAVNKQKSRKFHMKRFNLKKLNEVKGKEQYIVEVSNWCSALEVLVVDVDTIVLGKLLERISAFQPKRVYVVTN